MGKSKHKKPFIDKKSASTYHLLHRSQRDVGSDVLEEGDTSGMILWPSPNNDSATDEKVLFGSCDNKQSDKMKEWRQKLQAAGLLDEDPNQYLKPITGTGTFLDATGHVSNSLVVVDPRSQALEEEALMEVDRQFDSIPLTADCMDEEIAEALFGDFEEGDYEELNDEFVLDAAKELEEPNEADVAFDFDEHIRKLMKKARLERTGTSTLLSKHEHGQIDQGFFSKRKPLHERDDDCDSFAEVGSYNEGTVMTTPGVFSALSPEEEKALCEKFEETLAEYDSDECGDCPEEEIHGMLPIDGDTQVEAALDDFLQEKEDEIFMQGASHYLDNKKGGSGFSALVGKQMVPAKDLDQQDVPEAEPVEETLAKARERLAEPPLKPPAEEILIDGQSYFSERTRNPWDCESILSTYSNLDNNPVTIGASGRRKKKKNKKAVVQEESVEQIRLSSKTGLPLGALPARISENDDDVDDTVMSVNKGERRKKGETLEEKKARKEAIKRERMIARIQKKITKEVFKEAEKRAVDVVSDEVAGKSVFRYS